MIGPQYYALADVLVAPSLLEAFGLPAVEAAAAVPVVASATGGLLDTVVPGQTGLLVPPGDAAALARAIEVVVADRGRAVALGRAGRERAATSFTWDGIADTLAGYYESLLGRPTRSRVEIPVSLAAAAPAASRSRIRTERSSPARTSTDRSQEVGGSTLLGSTCQFDSVARRAFSLLEAAVSASATGAGPRDGGRLPSAR